nr:MAG TPA: hypothetical protein [Caudoviricetes sp.]
MSLCTLPSFIAILFHLSYNLYTGVASPSY